MSTARPSRCSPATPVGTWCTQLTSAERIDELEFTLGEGPSLAAYRSSVPELHSDVADPAAATRWPMLVPELVDLGVRAVFAFPLRLFNGARIGVLELYRTQPGRLDAHHYRAAADYAAALGPMVVDELDPSRNPTVVDPALFPRGKVHVAAGMMAVQLRVSPAAALARLRAMAFAQHRRITVIAQDIIAARLRFRPEDPGGN
ncbi:GAF domain-containing protein [Rhodococcus opacus]|uniref:GAF domain-containing protein n=1 Tax=Rhodococcus opacus TaxID=37919 RepID=UPI001FF49A39|nr:GAF domain-containing protein [Rhodococcus opacus]UOT03855.1 GAF domain-containing protein [Rhodococcus opacus]